MALGALDKKEPADSPARSGFPCSSLREADDSLDNLTNPRIGCDLLDHRLGRTDNREAIVRGSRHTGSTIDRLEQGYGRSTDQMY